MDRAWTERWKRRVGTCALAAALCALAARSVGAEPENASVSLAAIEAIPVGELPRAELPQPESNTWLGVVVTPTRGGVRVLRTESDGPAARAGIASGDVIRKLDDHRIDAAHDLTRVLKRRLPGERARVQLQRFEERLELDVELGAAASSRAIFRRAEYRLAVVPLRFADDADSRVDETRAQGLDRLLFERRGVRGDGASVADYVADQSFGRLGLTGRILAPVTLPGPRSEYAEQRMGAGPESAFQQALDRLVERDGRETVEEFDGLAFLYDSPAEARPGLALWPHRSSVRLGRRYVPYYVHSSNPDGSDGIGVHCHEFGHLIGLPDLYGAGHRTGVGDFCLMSLGHRGGGESGEREPFQLSAWARLRMGWIEPRVVDPRTTRRIRLAPLDDDATQAVVVPLDRQSTEYLLLEVRRAVGFDRRLPSHGLLVWHVGGEGTPGQSVYNAHVDLVEAHGLDVFDASLQRTDEIAFPTARARDLTPDTRPAVPPMGPRHLPVFLTDIRREPDGTVSFTLGDRRTIRQDAPSMPELPSMDDRGFVRATDPISGERVRFYVGPREHAPPGLVPKPNDAIGSERR